MLFMSMDVIVFSAADPGTDEQSASGTTEAAESPDTNEVRSAGPRISELRSSDRRSSRSTNKKTAGRRSTGGKQTVGRHAFSAGVFGPYHDAATAVTYDDELVPEGTVIGVMSVPRADGKTSVLIGIHGLLPNRTYGAHVHVSPIGARPTDTGPHFQHRIDPVRPSVSAEYANPRNEIWLDFVTNAHGLAVASATVDWQFTDRHARSVMLHAEATRIHDGRAGTAGCRLAGMNHTF